MDKGLEFVQKELANHFSKVRIFEDVRFNTLKEVIWDALDCALLNNTRIDQEGYDKLIDILVDSDVDGKITKKVIEHMKGVNNG